ncbi:hypothetical protein B0H11DRAFT_1928961 [Mycena galericulata]|nr:hypothetical protein B0H11DRAFT_1928961 [Mycena galericulata]
MLFSNALLFSASFAALIVPGVLAIPSPDSGTVHKIHFLIRIFAHQADVNVGAGTATPTAIISTVGNIVDKTNQVASMVKAMANANPDNSAISPTIAQVNAVRDELAPTDDPLGGAIGGCMNGDPNAVSGLDSGLLGDLLAGPTSGLLASVLDGGVSNLVNGLLGGLLGGLTGLLGQLLGDLGDLQGGCGCGTDLLTDVLALLQELVADLLSLLNLGSSYDCASDPQLLATVTGLLVGL